MANIAHVIAVAALLALQLLLTPCTAQFIENSEAILLVDDTGDSYGYACDVSGDWSLVSHVTADSNKGFVSTYYFNQWNWTAANDLYATDGAAGDRFGHSIAAHEKLAVIGASQHDAAGITDSGAAYVVSLVDSTTWVQEAKLVPAAAETGWKCGTSVAIRGDFVVVGCPNEVTGGVAVLYQRRETETAGTYAWHEIATLKSDHVDGGDQFGWSVGMATSYDPGNPLSEPLDQHAKQVVPAIWNYTIVVGAPYASPPGRFSGSVSVFYYDYLEDGCGSITPCAFNRTWREGAVLISPYGEENQLMGFDCDIDRGVVVAGAPGHSSGSIFNSGASFMFRRGTSGWAFEAKLEAKDVEAEAEFGWSVGVSGNASIVGAPGATAFEKVAAGAAYMYLFTGVEWQQATRVTAEGGQKQDGFGYIVNLDTSGIIGAHQADNLEGRVYQYGGYEFFPIPPPVFDPPPGLYFVPDALQINTITNIPSEFVHYTLNGSQPRAAEPASPKAIGKLVTLPFIKGRITTTLTAISASQRLGRLFTSFSSSGTYTTSTPIPGKWWDGEYLQPCNATRHYCPGVFGDHFRRTVDTAHYTTPVTPGTERFRVGQSLCEMEWYCVDGERISCGESMCWPYPVIVEAAESLDPAKRQPGIGPGDRLLLHFNTNTTMPDMNTTELVNAAVSLSSSIGTELHGWWLDERTLELTIVDYTGAADPIMTRLEDFSLTILPAGDIRRQFNTTQPADVPTPIVMRHGSWGDVKAPELVSATADFNGTQSQDSGHGPSIGDTLLLQFDIPVDTSIPANTRAEVDALVTFVPPVDIDYVGQWVGDDQLLITFVSQVPGPLFEYDISRGRFSVGTGQIAMRVPSTLRSRDRSSPTVNNDTPITFQGSWGDIVQNPYLTYDSPTGITLYFETPETNPTYATSGFILELATNASFHNSTIVYHEFMPRNASGIHTRTFAVPTNDRYFARAFTYVDSTSTRLGPYALPRPRSLEISHPSFKQLKGTNEIANNDAVSTNGGVFVFEINDLGSGPLALPHIMQFDASYTNGIDTHKAVGCYLTVLDGATMTCNAVAGVGRDFRWKMTVRGHESDWSPFVTHYLAPVVYFFDPQSPGSTDALSNGTQLVKLRGANFGPVATNNVTRVYYHPNLHPDVTFEALACNVTIDNIELTCRTAKGAGTDLRWHVEIAHQASAIISTTYGGPVIHHVGLSSDMDAVVLDTKGGEELVVTGINFGPDRADIPVVLQYVTSSALMDVSNTTAHDEQYPKLVFSALRCRVAQLHVEVRCTTPPGYAVRPFAWTINVLDQVSPVYPSAVAYGLPSIALDDGATTPTNGNTRVVSGSFFAATFQATHVQLVYRSTVMDKALWFATSDTSLTFEVPVGTGMHNSLVLVVNGQASNTIKLAYEPPVIHNYTLRWQQKDQLAQWQLDEMGMQHITASPLATRCLALQVYGLNFGVDSSVVAALVAGVPCETLVLFGHHHLECCTHERSGNVTVTVDGQTSAPVHYDVQLLVPTLRIHSVTPDAGDSIGTELTLHGEEFQSGGEPMGWVRVRVPGFEHTDELLCDVNHYNDSVVRCDQRPTDERYTEHVYLTVVTYSHATQTNVTSNEILFVYRPPQVEIVYPDKVVAKGSIVTLHGASFGKQGVVSFSTTPTTVNASTTPASAVLQSHRCWPVLSWSHTQVVCVAPPSAGNATVALRVPWIQKTAAQELAFEPVTFIPSEVSVNAAPPLQQMQHWALLFMSALLTAWVAW